VVLPRYPIKGTTKRRPPKKRKKLRFRIFDPACANAWRAAMPSSAQFSNTERLMDGFQRNDGLIMDQALLEPKEREGKLIESEWIEYRDEVLRSFSHAPPAAHLLVLRSTFFAGAYSLLRRIAAGGGNAERRLRLIHAELERFNAEIGSSCQRRG
jgi:hypothetical protein